MYCMDYIMSLIRHNEESIAHAEQRLQPLPLSRVEVIAIRSGLSFLETRPTTDAVARRAHAARAAWADRRLARGLTANCVATSL